MLATDVSTTRICNFLRVYGVQLSAGGSGKPLTTAVSRSTTVAAQSRCSIYHEWDDSACDKPANRTTRHNVNVREKTKTD